ncbi:MAG: hypothetical protein LBN34_07870 [Clostridiales Family XIII bacterium]|jgi:uncharacterized CHY-type Zn-finger protein|nr:hypothetical protein [Clostridiales Family XIII bacterium]
MRTNDKNAAVGYEMRSEAVSRKVCAICEKEIGTYDFRGRKVCPRCMSVIKKDF